MENLAEKSVPTLESSQPQGQNALPKPPAGKRNTPVMTEEEISDLLARLQDVLSLWEGSDNKIIGNYVMTAFPIPASMKIDKIGHDTKVFTVNGTPVVGVERS
jgi:hypothetical protein